MISFSYRTMNILLSAVVLISLNIRCAEAVPVEQDLALTLEEKNALDEVRNSYKICYVF